MITSVDHLGNIWCDGVIIDLLSEERRRLIGTPSPNPDNEKRRLGLELPYRRKAKGKRK